MGGLCGKCTLTLVAGAALLMGETAPAFGQFLHKKAPCCPAPCPIPCPPPDVESQAAPTLPEVPPPPQPEAKPEPRPEPRPQPKPEAAPLPQQPPPPPETPAPEPAPTPEDASGGEPLAMFDSSVGYIDTAIPGNVMRLRYDTAYNNNRPNRAEFFYAKGAPGGPGLPLPEVSVDFQTLEAYFERLFTPHVSGFLSVPARFLDPQVNDIEDGFGDMEVGFKYAFLNRPDMVSSFQFRTYIPTGDSTRGLGTNHVSLEPSLLVFRKLTDKINWENELRYWVAVGGTNFAGDLVRYGTGFSYGERPPDRMWLTPVAEIVGWTVLSGKETAVFFPGATPVVQDASGDTIVNVKAGFRLGFGHRANLYFGYGRALTGDVWYKDLYRAEFRLMY